jgi:hypothetical protein
MSEKTKMEQIADLAAQYPLVNELRLISTLQLQQIQAWHSYCERADIEIGDLRMQILELENKLAERTA